MKVFIFIALAACAVAVPVEEQVVQTDALQVAAPKDASVPVKDTAEVATAKSEFQAAFNAAAARAKAAPDFDLDGKISTYSGFLSGIDGKLSPFYTDSLPYGAYGLHAPVFPGAPLVLGGKDKTGQPLTYSALGVPKAYSFPSVYGFQGTYGFPGTYGYPGTFSYPGTFGFPGTFGYPGYPFIQIAKPKE